MKVNQPSAHSSASDGPSMVNPTNGLTAGPTITASQTSSLPPATLQVPIAAAAAGGGGGGGGGQFAGKMPTSQDNAVIGIMSSESGNSSSSNSGSSSSDSSDSSDENDNEVASDLKKVLVQSKI